MLLVVVVVVVVLLLIIVIIIIMGVWKSWPQIKEITHFFVFCSPLLHLFLLKRTIAIHYLVTSPKSQLQIMFRIVLQDI